MRTRLREDQLNDHDVLSELEAYGFIDYLKNVPNGLAGLDQNGLISFSQIPSLSLTGKTHVVASQSEMLALDGYVGNVAIRSDVNQTFILKAEPSSDLDNWQQLLISQTVESINGLQGQVTLTSDSLEEGYNNLYFTSARAKTAAVINNTSGTQTDQSASVQALKNYVTSTLGFTPSFTLFVGKNGNDLTGTGSINSPFSTINGALNYVAANITDSGANVIILVAPGTYSENITLTRPRTHLIGLVKSQSNSILISGNITINPSEVVGGLYNSIFALEGFLIAPSSGDAVTITGTNECNVFITNVYCYVDGPGTQKAIVANQTSSTKTRISLTSVLCNTVVAASQSISFSNAVVTCDKVTCYAAGDSALSLVSTTLTANNCWFETNNSSLVISVDGTSIFSLGNSYLYNKYSGGDGISILTGGQAIVVHNTFQITGTSGFAVRGVSGAVFLHALNCFIPGTNNKMSSAMGAGAVTMTTTFTSA